MRQALDGMARLLGAEDCLGVQWQMMRFQHVNAIKATLNEQYKPATVNKYLSALRGVLLASKQLGLMSVDDYDRAVSVKSVKGSTLPAGRDLSDKEIRRLFAVCEADLTPAGVRDAALFGILRIGLRVTEIAELTLADFDPTLKRLTVRGKGNKERLVPITGGSLQALLDWLTVRGNGSGLLFYAINKGGRIIERGITRQAIFKICSKRALEARIPDFSPHDFRRTFVGDMLDAGADIVTVKDLAGHASIQTTARYDRRGQERLQNA
ncbi:MAG: tyrosine-type recombinase/integrase, partial [Anaerolineae bacterium]|nr:tyrosine-type recombinase/integrase [Anaerolineae bacterium]